MTQGKEELEDREREMEVKRSCCLLQGPQGLWAGSGAAAGLLQSPPGAGETLGLGG